MRTRPRLQASHVHMGYNARWGEIMRIIRMRWSGIAQDPAVSLFWKLPRANSGECCAYLKLGITITALTNSLSLYGIVLGHCRVSNTGRDGVPLQAPIKHWSSSSTHLVNPRAIQLDSYPVFHGAQSWVGRTCAFATGVRHRVYCSIPVAQMTGGECGTMNKTISRDRWMIFCNKSHLNQWAISQGLQTYNRIQLYWRDVIRRWGSWAT